MAEREYRLPEPNQYEADKAAFLKQFSDWYGYSGRIDQIRDKEYPQLKGKAYLDHAGTTTYNQSTINNFHADLSHNLFGNPHSKSPSSKLATERVEGVRLRVLQHFKANPDHYEVIFTANTTAAIKLVGEAFPWEKDITSYKYLREGHTSLLGLRRFAEESNVREINVTNEFELEEDLLPKHVNNPHFHNNIQQVDFEGQTDGVPVIPEGVHYNLFAYPAQCNFSGMRFPLDWVRRVKQTYNTENSKTLVLLDAAAYTTTSPLSLEDTENSPDFMSISFYKLFGYPTGLGALIIKKELNPILKKRYFGGGTVTTVFWNMPLQRFHDELHERYEDGTINFLSIIALEHAFNSSQRLYKDFTLVRAHVTSLNQYLFKEMDSLRHWNGTRVVTVNSDRDFSDWTRQGPILSFNLKRADGSWVGYSEVEHLAGVNGIHVRVGAHCNAGSVSRWCNVNPEDYENKSCNDDQDIVNGKPMGAIRISLGAMTNIDDILIWLDFLKAFFVEGAPPTSMFKDLEDVENDLYDLSDSSAKALETSPKVALDTISLFPIKSCHAYQVPSDKSWPVTTQGLLYDREWVLLNPENGQALSQKRHPKMALIKPKINLEEGVLEITAPDYNPICIALEEYPALEEETTTNASVCGDRTDTLPYTSPEITEWFTNFLGAPCVLARQLPAVYNEYPEISINRRFIKRHLEESSQYPLSFSNESPFLLISQESVNNVNSKVRDAGNEEIETECFRGNFVVRGTSEYEEDDWKLIKFGDQAFKVLGPCRRCNMVTVNQETAERTNEPYSTLSKHRKFDGKIYFGQHMIHVPELSQAPYNLRPGAPLKILERTRPLITARF